MSDRPREHSRDLGIAARRRDDTHVAARRHDVDNGAIRGAGLEECGRGLPAQKIGKRRGIHDPPHNRVVRISR